MLDEHFDLEKLALSQNFNAQIAVKKVLNTVPKRKPNKQEFVRVHPDPAWRLETKVLEIEGDREIYLVAPELWDALREEISPRVLFVAITRQGVVFVWPVKLPDEDGKQLAWHQSALDAAKRGMTNWVRVRANMELGAYECFEALVELSDPKWPEESFKQIIRTAFKDHYIDSLEHVVIRKLRGEI
jgi:hypothetical protein